MSEPGREVTTWGDRNSVSMEEQLRIGELAAELGLNPKTIRYYEEIGVLPQPRRTRAGYRLYGTADRERLRFIVKARAIGLTLEEIGDVLALRRRGERPCEHVLALLDRKIAGINQQLRTLKDVRQELVALRLQTARSLPAEGAVCGIIEHHVLLREGWLLAAVAATARPRRGHSTESGARPPAARRHRQKATSAESSAARS